MNNASNQELIAPCGMNCGICVSFFGYAVNGRKRKNACPGCRLRDKLCTFLKKQCENLSDKKLDKRYKIKYRMSMIENLKYIQKNGIKKFIEKERVRWKCSKCGGIICVHDKRCYTCEI